jgi:hypothetical protein
MEESMLLCEISAMRRLEHTDSRVEPGHRGADEVHRWLPVEAVAHARGERGIPRLVLSRGRQPLDLYVVHGGTVKQRIAIHWSVTPHTFTRTLKATIRTAIDNTTVQRYATPRGWSSE